MEETTARIDEINDTIANETEGDAPRRARMLRAVSLASRAQIAANLTGGSKTFSASSANLTTWTPRPKKTGGVIVNVVKFGDTWEMPDD